MKTKVKSVGGFSCGGTREQACANKHKHPTQSAAVKQLIALEKQKKMFNYSSYKCGYCNFWHVGRSKAKGIKFILNFKASEYENKVTV